MNAFKDVYFMVSITLMETKKFKDIGGASVFAMCSTCFLVFVVGDDDRVQNEGKRNTKAGNEVRTTEMKTSWMSEERIKNSVAPGGFRDKALSLIIQVKVELSLYLTKHHAMKTHWGSVVIAARIL
jgi:hypothetical protein